jgi:hypothetical protein
MTAALVGSACSGGASPLNSAVPTGSGSPAGSAAATPSPLPSESGSPGGSGLAGQELCSLLTPADFTAAGVSGAASPRTNSTTPNDAYCVYAGNSSATGGIEFDIFIEASATDAQGVYTNAALPGPPTDVVAEFTGIDQAQLATTPFAMIVVRRDTVTFDIGFPANPKAHDQLTTLANLVLTRSAPLMK